MTLGFKSSLEEFNYIFAALEVLRKPMTCGHGVFKQGAFQGRLLPLVQYWQGLLARAYCEPGIDQLAIQCVDYFSNTGTN